MSLNDAARVIGFALIGAAVVLVAVKLFSRRINTSGLFSIKGGDDAGAVSPARAQLFATSLFVAGNYLKEVLSTDSLPDVPLEFVALFGASQIVYAVSKAWSTYHKRT